MNKVFELMNQIDKQDQTAREQREWQNSTEYKLRAIPDEEKKARGICLDKLFAKVYKDAVPLNDEYKVARGEDLDVEIKDFMDARCPEGMEYYVKEAIKKGSVPCKKMYEAVNNLVHSYYAELSKDIENVDPSQLAFQMTDENIKKLDVISDDLNFDEVSAAIGLNVKRTAAAEIARSKDEKERSEQLERELKDDLDVMDEDQIQERLESVNYSDDPIYTPSLFEGIMIGETNKYRAMAESGEFDGAYEYNALSTFGIVKESAYVPTSVVEKAFIESVKEMTKLQLLKTFKMESFDAERTRLMAESYAYESAGANGYKSRRAQERMKINEKHAQDELNKIDYLSKRHHLKEGDRKQHEALAKRYKEYAKANEIEAKKYNTKEKSKTYGKTDKEYLQALAGISKDDLQFGSNCREGLRSQDARKNSYKRSKQEFINKTPTKTTKNSIIFGEVSRKKKPEEITADKENRALKFDLYTKHEPDINKRINKRCYTRNASKK